MLKHLRPALVMLVALTAITGLLYPLAITGIAQGIFPAQASGSIVERDGRIVGSALIGQSFTGPGYFHGRPSATARVPYNAAASSGSNLGPTNPALLKRIESSAQALAAENPGKPIPIDLVTSSGSGLDPDISPEAAAFQVPRIAAERELPEEAVRTLVEAHTVDRTLGLLGESHLNVLALNLALDELAAR